MQGSSLAISSLSSHAWLLALRRGTWLRLSGGDVGYLDFRCSFDKDMLN